MILVGCSEAMGWAVSHSCGTPKTGCLLDCWQDCSFCLVASPQGIFGCLLNMEAGSSESKSSKIELECVL